MIEYYNEDCIAGMARYPDKHFDLAIVDPPYRNASDNQPTKDMRKNGNIERFGNKPDDKYFTELFRLSKTRSYGAQTILIYQTTRVLLCGKS